MSKQLLVASGAGLLLLMLLNRDDLPAESKLTPSAGWESPGSRPTFTGTEIQRKRKTESERKNQLLDAEESRRRQAEAEARKRQEEAEARKRQEEAEARKRQEEAEARQRQAEAEAQKRQQIIDAENRRRSNAIAVGSAQRAKIAQLPVRSYVPLVSTAKSSRNLQAGYLANGELGGRMGRAVWNLVNAHKMDARRSNMKYWNEAMREFPVRFGHSTQYFMEIVNMGLHFGTADLNNTFCVFCGLIVHFHDLSVPCAGNLEGGHSYEPVVLMLQTTPIHAGVVIHKPDDTKTDIPIMSSFGPFHFCSKCDTLCASSGACQAGGTHSMTSKNYYLNSNAQDIIPKYSQHLVKRCKKCDGFYMLDGKSCSGGGIHERSNENQVDYWIQIVKEQIPPDWNHRLLDVAFESYRRSVQLWKWAKEQWGWFYGDVRQPGRNEALLFYTGWLKEFKDGVYDSRDIILDLLRDNPIDYSVSDVPGFSLNDSIYHTVRYQFHRGDRNLIDELTRVAAQSREHYYQRSVYDA